jgi:hypothetical protein
MRCWRRCVRGVAHVTVTLHVGAGTFLPVRRRRPWRSIACTRSAAILTAGAAAAINARGQSGAADCCGGHHEPAACWKVRWTRRGVMHEFDGETDMFILPGHKVRSVDLLLTNFHLPRSTLFMLVCAFAGTARMRAAYEHAIAAGYRFYSYGDARCWSAHEFSWQAVAQDGAARAGVLHTAHGDVATPVFMPVGTAGTVKAMTADAVRSTGAGIVLGNTYHLMLRPGAERVARLGGLHRFMDWPGPILTDSGGFQVMSLGALRTLDADGVTFRRIWMDRKHRLTPERSIEIQHLLDATITMVLDECTPFPATHEQALLAWRCPCAGRRAARGVRGACGIRRCSASCRAAYFPVCARNRPLRCGRSGSRATHWRPGGRRGPGRDVRRAGGHRAAFAGRRAALPDGRRHAGRSAGRGGARGGHVRLRHADARRPHRARLYQPRRAEHAQCAPCGG